MNDLIVGMRVRRKPGSRRVQNFPEGAVGIINSIGSNGYFVTPAGSTKEIFCYKENLEAVLDFEIGDKVTAFGVEGVVYSVKVTDQDDPYSVVVQFPLFGDKRILFTADGKYETWHAEPSLKLIEKWKPMKEEIKIFVSNTIHKLDLVDQFDGKFGGKNVRITIEEIR